MRALCFFAVPAFGRLFTGDRFAARRGLVRIYFYFRLRFGFHGVLDKRLDGRFRLQRRFRPCNRPGRFGTGKVFRLDSLNGPDFD